MGPINSRAITLWFGVCGNKSGHGIYANSLNAHSSTHIHTWKKKNKEKTFPATSTASRRAAHCVVRVLQQSRKVVAASKENVLDFGGLSATLLMADIKSVLSLLGPKKKGDVLRTPSLNICFGDVCHVWKTLAFIIRSGEKRKQNIPSAL